MIFLDGDISTLVKQRHDGWHILRRSIKLAGISLHSCDDVCWNYLIFAHHIDEISWSSGSKPIGSELVFCKAIQQAIWIEDIG